MDNEKIKQKYSIGLDIGDTSVGWAVISDDFGVVKKGEKRLIGTRLFDIGESAKSRRLQRISRRRLERRRERIQLLRDILSEEIDRSDPSFFQRLDMSFLKKGDEFGRRFTYNLFDGIGLTDKGFYKRFPTIYHLRKYLIDTEEKADIRWIYLALHHMIKYRGNFLFEGDSEHIEGFKQGSLKELLAAIDEICGSNYSDMPEETIFAAEKVLTDKSKPRSDRVKTAADVICDKGSKNNFIEAFKALTGQTFKLSTACFSDVAIEAESGKDAKLSFDSDTYDEEEAKYIDELGNYSSILGCLKKLYYQLEYNDILGENKYLCEAMLERYNEHKKDKALVKSILKRYVYDSSEEGQKAYRNFFGNDPAKNDAIGYSNYIKKPSKMKDGNKPGTPEEFLHKKIKELVEKYALDKSYLEDPEYIKMETVYKTRGLLPKINSKRNGAIPNQMHLKEMNVILEKQGKYYPCLSENADKIRSILTFIRPYYVGVLGKNSPNSSRRAVYFQASRKMFGLSDRTSVAKAIVFVQRIYGFKRAE